ncbi:hypothetical protein CEP54_002237 [Fusarium duplospermum]|uniref:Uncharacterized protein n=1 Tax=Fusarium duplospermum TaxID=1325734 RepID=A0A428QWS0_9HYPO|nr:hypothetical protein CEP54_002237 [Fusarium duplospermum]
MEDQGRLYVALYLRGGRAKMPHKENKFHWAFITGPSVETPETRGVLHHIKEDPEMMKHASGMMWKYLEHDVPTGWTGNILVRIYIGEVKDMDRVHFIFHNTPLQQCTLGWNCIKWAEDAFTTITQDGKALSKAVTDWDAVRDKAMEYVDAKVKAHRFELCREFEQDDVPTWDMLNNKEIAF